MPIYAYRCDVCGHAKDVLQKISDPVLTTCPGCGADTFKKQLTAAGFQLKGSGWYVTDFRNAGGKGAAKPDAQPETQPDAKADAKPDAKPDGAKSEPAAPAAAAATTTASATPSSGGQSAPAGGSGTPSTSH